MPSHEPTDITAEFYIDGEWRDTYNGTDLTARVRGNDAIRITRGLADQQSAVSPAQAVFKLNDRDGLYVDDNPYSPLWGKLGLNTRCRLGVKHTAGHWDEYVRFPDFDDTDTDQNVTTTDKASLDITGDIDIRVEYTPYYTRGPEMVLAGKWLPSSNQCSWLLLHRPGGQIKIFTSPDGTSGASLAVTTTPALVAENATRVAVRVTIDVNDGGGNRVYRFYTADSISGSWTQQASLTTAGTTSIFSSTENLELGSAADGSGGAFTGVYPLRGKLHAFELYNGIAGTLVADFKPQGKGLETTTWADTCASPNTWVLNGDNIRLASDRVRITGELSSLPDEWDVSGNDRWVPVTLSGVLKRYQDNSAPLKSALYQNWRNYPGLTGGWSLEDEAGSTQAASFLPNGIPGAITSCTFGAATGLDGSGGALTLTSAPGVSKAVFTANTATNTGETSFIFYFQLATGPAGVTTFCTLNTNGGTVASATFAVGTVSFTFSFYDKLGALLDSGAAGFGETPVGQWLGLAVTMKQEGSDIRWETTWHKVGTNTFYTHNPGGDIFAGTASQFKKATFDTNDAAWAGAQLSYVIFANDEIEINTARFRDASKGYDGEVFGRRAIRLAEQEGTFFEWLGDPDDTEACGPQAIDTLFNNLASGAKVDGGILDSPRDRFGYRYITRRYLGNRRGLTLAYGDSTLAAVPLPTNDNRYTVNDFTATRPSGSSARYEANDDRRKNVRDPDDATSPGIGRYERADFYGVSTDDQLPHLAQYAVSFGTWPERRIPQLSISLSRPEIYNDALLLEQVIAQDLGDPIILTVAADKPLPPNDMLMTELGYTETISNKLWEKVSNTVPAGPYQNPVFDGLFESEDEIRLAESGNTKIHCIDGTIETDSASIKIRTPASEPAWADSTSFSSEFDFDIGITGERMTVTACTVPSSIMGLHDGTFESGVPSSVTSACTFTQSSTFAHAGTFSGLITVVGSPGAATVRIPSTATVTRADAGDVVTLTVWLRTTAALTRRITLDWYDADGVFISKTDSDSAIASGSWIESSVTGTAPAGTKYVHYGWGLISSPAAGSLLYADDFVLTNASQNYQTLTVTRSVNTVEKTHSDGENVYLWLPAHIGR
jgi:hypothetical protein